jgi:hypothetical protein
VEAVRILSIVPADGWYAVFRAGPDQKGTEFKSRLLCWALVEARDGERSVVGLDADQRGTVEIAAYANNFVRYEFGVTT